MIVVLEGFAEIMIIRVAKTPGNIGDFMVCFPFGYKKKIGMEGDGIREGQKKSFKIRRDVYKKKK